MRFNIEDQPIPQGVSSPEAVAKFHASTEQIDTLRKELEEKRRILLNQFKEDFSKITNVFFEAVPRIKSLTWTQYTPYFMDGDPCEFGINDIYFATDENEDVESYRDFNHANGHFSDGLYGLKKLMTPQEVNLCEKMSSIIHGNEELMESIFGDHALIVLRASGVEVQEYDHD